MSCAHVDLDGIISHSQNTLPECVQQGQVTKGPDGDFGRRPKGVLLHRKKG